jgi:hypothetical protein
LTINAAQFRQYVLEPALDALVPAGIPRNPAADALVLATIAQESLLGTYLAQVDGPALGIGQIEPASLADLITRLTAAEYRACLTLVPPNVTFALSLPSNLQLATALVRLFYWHKPFPLATSVTIAWLWATYKQWYNTSAGAANAAKFVTNLGLTDLEVPPWNAFAF